MRKLVVGALTMLLLGACSSSSGSTSQPDDEFLDKVETACREAHRTIDKLDSSDASAPSDLRDALSDMSDTLDDLDPPDALKKDFETYVSNIDDEVAQMDQLVEELSSGGDAVAVEVATLNDLRNANDAAVNKLDIYSCLGLVPLNGLADAPDVTLPPTDTTVPDSTEPTEPSTTEVFTVPESSSTTTTATTEPSASTTSLPDDLSIDGVAPPGYTWVSYNPPDVSGLYSNTIIGDLVTYYAGGELQSDTDGATLTVYEVRLSEDFNERYTGAYQFWEAVENGSDVTTPGGLTVHQELEAFTNTDCGVYISGKRGVAVCVYSGSDGLSVMDAWIAANPA